MNDLKLPRPALSAPGYEDDLVAWTEWQIELLRAHRFEQLDLDNLLEELNAMVRRDRRELESRLIVVMVHLLKCQFQPQQKSHGWIGSLNEQRMRIRKLLAESPSLRRAVAESANGDYAFTAKLASKETGLPMTDFPAAISYTADELLDVDFIP
jgi:hypothetical protein